MMVSCKMSHFCHDLGCWTSRISYCPSLPAMPLAEWAWHVLPNNQHGPNDHTWIWHVCQTHPIHIYIYMHMCIISVSPNPKYITVAPHVPFDPPDNFKLFDLQKSCFFFSFTILTSPPHHQYRISYWWKCIPDATENLLATFQVSKRAVWRARHLWWYIEKWPC